MHFENVKFGTLCKSKNPGTKELKQFVEHVLTVLGTVINDDQNLRFLWDNRLRLRKLAKKTYEQDISNGTGLLLLKAIDSIPSEKLTKHGLMGIPLKFKFSVLDTIMSMWVKIKDSQLQIRNWLRKLFDAIDAILDSIIDAAGGAGALIKEFKDSLTAFVS